MARDSAGAGFLAIGSSGDWAGKSLCVHFWLRRDGSWFVGDWHGAGARQWLISGDGSNVNFQHSDGGILFSTGAATPSDEWCSVGLRIDDPGNEVALFINGVKTTNAFTALASNATGWEVGRAADAVFSDASFAEFAAWDNIALPDAAFFALAKGVNPQLIRRSALFCYVPILGRDSPERDYSGNGHHGTVTGTFPAHTAHAPVMPFMVPTFAGITIPADVANVFEDSDTVYLDLQPSSADIAELSDSATVYLDLQPSGVDVIERAPTVDAETIYLKLTVLGGECYSTFSAAQFGEGEANLRWYASLDTLRWSDDPNLRWTEADISLEAIHC